MIEKIVNFKFLNIAFIFFLSYFLISLFNREAHIDDYWLGEYAYWFSKLNYVKSELLRGYENYETKLLVYHKLFIVLGGYLIKTFSFNLFILKSISLTFLFYSIFIMWKILKSNKIIEDKNILFLLYLIILFSEPHIFELSFIYRPEILLMALGLSSFYFLDDAISNNKKSSVIICGIFSGLCFLTHLNGIVFILAAGFILLINKKFIHLLLFSVPAILVSLLYFWDVTSYDDFSLLIQQFQNDPALENDDFELTTYIINLLKEHERFFHSPPEIFISILFLLSLIYNYNYLKKNYRIFFQYYIISIIFLAIICYSKTPKYLVIYMPFICLVISLALHRLRYEIEIRTFFIKGIPFFFIVFLLTGIIFNFRLINYKTFTFIFPNNSIKAESPESTLPLYPGIKILGSFRYAFQFTDKYQLQGLHTYIYFERKNKYYKGKFNFLRLADFYSNKYILLDREYIEKLKLNDKEIQASKYRLIHKTSDLWILKSIRPN